MAEDNGKEEEKFDFTPEGEGYISLAEARVLAMQTASSAPGDYGRSFRGVAMVFEVVESGEDDDYYNITLSFRPQGNFDGTPGQEQFLIGKESTIALRQVLSSPIRKGGGFPVIPVGIGLVVVGAIAVVGAVFALSGSGGDNVPIAVVVPTETPAPAETAAPIEPTVDIEKTIEAGVQRGLAEVTPVPLAPAAKAVPTPKPTPAAKAVPTPKPTPAAKAVPTPKPTAAKAPATAAKPSGTLTVGQKELGPYVGNPKLIGNPQIFLNSAIPITETLGMYNFDNGRVGPMLAKSWEVSADGRVWTYHIRDDVDFHKGFGRMTVQDVVFSHRQVADSTKHARSANTKEIYFAEYGSQTTPDDFTWVVDTGVPFSPIPIWELMGTPRAVAAWVVSKKQWDQKGEDEANFNTAATGPWEIAEAKTGSFWRMKAVENHWRKTPAFAELMFMEIPEESARIAGFKTGNLDTFVMALDTISEVESVAGAVLMQVPNAIQAGLNFYGQLYVPARDGGGKSWPAYNPDNPWVSPNSNTNSPEWADARNVRLALSIAIDRQAIIDNLLLGFGHQLTLKDWMGFEDRLPSPQETWPYDPERAKALIADAGFPNGFSITLTPAIRGAPSEVEACEAVAQYWDAIGIDVDFQNVPYGTFRPTAVARTYEGVSCHNVGARLAPIQGMASFLNSGNFSWGSEHPILEEKIPAGQNSVLIAELIRIEDEIAKFNIEQVFAETGLYVIDNVWPVGPNINPWGDFIKQGDLRQINGFEYITPR